MSFLEKMTACSRGEGLAFFWRLYNARQRARTRPGRWVLSWLINRSACRHGGYVGPGAMIEGRPSLPHGLHGVYISRYARIGKDCRIYQNVTIGEVDGRAPRVGEGCLIGAGAVLVGDIEIGPGARIGAGATVAADVPPGCTAVAPAARILRGGGAGGAD